MAACNEIIGVSPLGRSSFLPGNRSVLLGSKQNKLCFASPALLEQRRKGRLPSMKKAAATPVVATISEEVVKLVVGKQQQKLKVRAALTVRRKLKEDLKEVIVNQLDALSDKIGRNVVLELISTEINPSKPRNISIWLLVLGSQAPALLCVLFDEMEEEKYKEKVDSFGVKLFLLDFW